MRLVLIGNFSNPDEARKVMSHYLYSELSRSKDLELLKVSTTNMSLSNIKHIAKFAPDIIHYIPGASPFSFWITKILQTASKNAKTLMFSALHPFHNPFYSPYYFLANVAKYTIPLVKTNLVLVQSDSAEVIFKKLGCNTKFFVYSGVDIEKFKPVTPSKKEELREIYKVDKEKRVFLHIGSIRKWRNIEHLVQVQKISPDIQVVVVGRTYGNDPKIRNILTKNGIKVLDTYIPTIEELYQLSDAYLFLTTNPIGSIDIPLSVLEAMATNLFIITTKFGGLPKIFREEKGLLWTTLTDLEERIKQILEHDSEPKTRELVLPYSWSNIAKNLIDIYKGLIEGETI